MADDLLAACPAGLADLLRRSPAQMRRTKGLGTVATARVAAALEIGRRAQQLPPENRPAFKSVSSVAEYFRGHYGAGAPEKFVAFFVSRQHRLLGELEVSRGSGSAVVVDPRRIFKQALLLEAKGVILAHNHPDGSLSPSQQDIDLTRQIGEAGKVCRIPVLSHVIVTGEDCGSVPLS